MTLGPMMMHHHHHGDKMLISSKITSGQSRTHRWTDVHGDSLDLDLSDGKAVLLNDTLVLNATSLYQN